MTSLHLQFIPPQLPFIGLLSMDANDKLEAMNDMNTNSVNKNTSIYFETIERDIFTLLSAHHLSLIALFLKIASSSLNAS